MTASVPQVEFLLSSLGREQHGNLHLARPGPEQPGASSLVSRIEDYIRHLDRGQDQLADIATQLRMALARHNLHHHQGECLAIVTTCTPCFMRCLLPTLSIVPLSALSPGDTTARMQCTT